MEVKGKRFYLCPPKPKGLDAEKAFEILNRLSFLERNFFFKKACVKEKKLYFCSRFENESSERKNKK
ncbi:hypothetical protein, partial [Flavobacterium sp. AG291]|uniref:hypothetical protein n=1 Tax=Flavobacterium sp. AG291 TaxID=2184000 RepID=UPI001F3E206B